MKFADAKKFTFAAPLAGAVLGLVLASGSYADTRNSTDKATMEQKASPAAPKSDEERAEASQGQPNVPHSIGGANVRDTAKDGKKSGKKPDASSGRPETSGSSTGASAPGAGADAGADKAQAFKRFDIDGDGSISKAEAAGNGKLMNAFDGADKDRDGKLSRAEYDSMGSAPQAKAKAKSSAKVKAPAQTTPERP